MQKIPEVSSKAGNSIMMKTSLFLGGIILVSVGAYAAYNKLKGGKSSSSSVPNMNKDIAQKIKDAAGSIVNTVKPPTANNFPLKNGSKNDNVRTLQSALNRLGQDPALVVDGIFGSKTQASLKAYTGKTTVDSQSELDAIANRDTSSGKPLVYNPNVDEYKYLGTWNQLDMI